MSQPLSSLKRQGKKEAGASARRPEWWHVLASQCIRTQPTQLAYARPDVFNRRETGPVQQFKGKGDLVGCFTAAGHRKLGATRTRALTHNVLLLRKRRVCTLPCQATLPIILQGVPGPNLNRGEWDVLNVLLPKDTKRGSIQNYNGLALDLHDIKRITSDNNNEGFEERGNEE